MHTRRIVELQTDDARVWDCVAVGRLIIPGLVSPPGLHQFMDALCDILGIYASSFWVIEPRLIGIRQVELAERVCVKSRPCALWRLRSVCVKLHDLDVRYDLPDLGIFVWV